MNVATQTAPSVHHFLFVEDNSILVLHPFGYNRQETL